MRRLIQAALFLGVVTPCGLANAQSDSSQQPATTPSATTAQPGQPAAVATPATPANGTGSQAPAPAAEPAPPPPPPPLPWRGTSFIWDHSVSTDTVSPNSVLSPQPSYQWWLSLRPRWTFNRNWAVSVRQDLTLEMFDNGGQSGSTRIREPQLGDLWTDIQFRGIPTFGGGFRVVVAARAQWPLSLTSQARGTYVTVGAVANLSRAFDLGRGHELSASLGFVGTSAFTRYRDGNNVIGTGYDCVSADYTPQVCGNLGGAMNSAFNFTTLVTLGYTPPVRGLSFNVMAVLINNYLYPTPEARIVDQMGGTTVIERSPLDQRVRQSSWVLLSADYDVTKWLSLSAGYYSFHSVLGADGQYTNPFWNPSATNRIFVTLTFALDEIYNAISNREGRRPANAPAGGARSITMNSIEPENPTAPSRVRRRWTASDSARELRVQQFANGSLF